MQHCLHHIMAAFLPKRRFDSESLLTQPQNLLRTKGTFNRYVTLLEERGVIGFVIGGKRGIR